MRIKTGSNQQTIRVVVNEDGSTDYFYGDHKAERDGDAEEWMHIACGLWSKISDLEHERDGLESKERAAVKANGDIALVLARVEAERDAALALLREIALNFEAASSGPALVGDLLFKVTVAIEKVRRHLKATEGPSASQAEGATEGSEKAKE